MISRISPALLLPRHSDIPAATTGAVSVPWFTVVIPTHNPSKALLARVLAALRAQTLSQEFWEAIVVDNRSDEPLHTAEWSQHLPGVVVRREERLGCAFARLAGIAAARAPLLLFIDDDNVLRSDFLANAQVFMKEHPEVGVLGGRIVGDFAVPPPAWVRPHFSLLALRDFGENPLISSHQPDQAPAYDYFAPLTAGMVLRTEVARSYAQWAARSPSHWIGRRGTDLTGAGCDDCQLVLHAIRNRYQCAYSPDLQVTHVIPARRLQFDYLCRLNRHSQQSWGTFCRLHNLRPGIPRWTVPLRQAKAFFTRRAWTRAGFIHWRGLCGYFRGLATRFS